MIFVVWVKSRSHQQQQFNIVIEAIDIELKENTHQQLQVYAAIKSAVLVIDRHCWLSVYCVSLAAAASMSEMPKSSITYPHKDTKKGWIILYSESK